jgi:hypothetical protein
VRVVVKDSDSLQRGILAVVDYGERLFESLPGGRSEDAYVLSFEKVKKIRSNNQNKLYWLWMSVLSETTGYTKEEMSEICKRMFLQWKTVHVFGEMSMVPIESKSLTTVEFTEYLNKIALWASEQGVSLPYPEDLGYEAIATARCT